MNKDVIQSVTRCLECQQVKEGHCPSTDILQLHDIIENKWEGLSLYFLVGSPMTPKRNYFIINVIYFPSKGAHFIPTQRTFNVAVIAQVFLQEIVQLGKIPPKHIKSRFLVHFLFFDSS